MILSRGSRAPCGLALAAGCNTLPPDPEGPALAITLAGVFAGRAAGGGHYRLGHVLTEWRFRVRINGRRHGERLVSDVDFLYAHGSSQRLARSFRRRADGGWSGSYPGMTATGEIPETGRTIRPRHGGEITGPQGRENPGFDEMIHRPTDGRLVVDSIVAHGGTPFANMRLKLSQER